MTVKELWTLVILGAVVVSLTVIGLIWVTSSGSTVSPEGEVPQLTKAEIQEYATARWWEDQSPREQVELCISVNILGKDIFKDLAVENDLNPDQLWKFLGRKCDL